MMSGVRRRSGFANRRRVIEVGGLRRRASSHPRTCLCESLDGLLDNLTVTVLQSLQVLDGRRSKVNSLHSLALQELVQFFPALIHPDIEHDHLLFRFYARATLWEMMYIYRELANEFATVVMQVRAGATGS